MVDVSYEQKLSDTIGIYVRWLDNNAIDDEWKDGNDWIHKHLTANETMDYAEKYELMGQFSGHLYDTAKGGYGERG